MDLYNLLSTKSKNNHYLKRYINFIKNCKNKNKQENSQIYTEKHHICPKANDLFPEYKNLKLFKWNRVDLTAKQHIIAHIMLYKIYGGSQIMALECILSSFNSNTNVTLSNRIIPSKYNLDYIAKIRKERGLSRVNKSTYKDEKGRKYFLKNDDPKIKELNLVGNNKGKTLNDEQKKRLSDSKLANRKVVLYFLDCSVKIKLFSNDYDNYLSQGWNQIKTIDDINYIKEKTNKLFSEKYKGLGYYYTQDGIFYGRVAHDDPLVKSLSLVKKKSDKQKEQQKNGLTGAIHNRGKKAYNNGIIEKNFFENEVPDGWVKGGLKRKKEQLSTN